MSMKRISIKYKISGLMIFVIIISNVFLGILNYDNSKTVASNIIINNNEAELQNISDYYFDKLIYDMEYIVNQWADAAFIKNYDKSTRTPRIVNSIPDDFLSIYDQWIGLTSSMHDITWIYYALESDGSILIAPVDVSMPSTYDARKRDWYKGTLNQSGTIYWTEPYTDAGDSGKILQTVSKAVYKDGALKGVVGLDIELTKFTEIIENLSFAKSSYIFLINQSNDIIAHNSNNVEFYKQTFIDKVSWEKSSVLQRVNEDDFIISWTPLNINGWKLVAVTKTTFRDQLSAMRHQIIMIALVSALVCIVFSYLGFKSILVHLNSLIDITNHYTGGNLKVRCEVDSNDEFKTLANSMNNMLSAIESLINERDENYIKTVKVLANAIEASDEYTRGHCDRVGDISKELGKIMGLNEQEQRQLEFACILHDIGKIAIPEQILNKTSHLTDSEFNIVKSHPQVGHDILKDIHFLDRAKQIILQHHERLDGSGYPNKLTAKDICLEARILTVADAYDAMSSERVYRKSILSDEEIESELRKCSGTQFDKRVVDALIYLMHQDAK